MKLRFTTALVLLANVSYAGHARADDAEKYVVEGRYEKSCDANPSASWWKVYNKSASMTAMAEANALCAEAVGPAAEPRVTATQVVSNTFDADTRKCASAVAVEFECGTTPPPPPTDPLYTASRRSDFACVGAGFDPGWKDPQAWRRYYYPTADLGAREAAQERCTAVGKPTVVQAGEFTHEREVYEVGFVAQHKRCAVTSTITFRCRD